MGLFLSMVDGVAYTDQKGTILRVNPALCTLLGYTDKELIGRTILDFTPQEEHEAEVKTVAALIADTKNSCEIEKHLCHKDGHHVPVLVRLWISRTPDGDILGIWGSIRDLTAQRKAEEAATTNMERYRFLTENSEDVIWAVDKHFKYTYLSPSIELLRGYTPDELLGSSFQDSMTPKSLAKALESINKTIHRGQQGETDLTDRLELELLCKDGSTVWGEIVARATRDENGEWVGIVGSTRDISARKRMEERLSESEKSMKALISATDDYVGLFTPEGRILIVNIPLVDWINLAPEDVIGRKIYEVIPALLHDNVRKAFAKAMKTQKPVKGSGFYAGKFFESRIFPVVGADGEVTSLAVFAKDLTESRLAEEMQKKTQEQYRLIVETANEGILGLDADQRVTYANDIVAKFLGYEVTELIGNSILDYIEPSELEDNHRRISRRGAGQRERYERRFVRKDGSIVWAMVSASPMEGEDGSFLGAFAMVTDITEVKQAHERLLTILDGIDADIFVSDFETHEILFMNAHMQDRHSPLKANDTCYDLLQGLAEQCDFCTKPKLVGEDGELLDTVISEWYDPQQKRWLLNHDRAIEWLEGRLVHMHMATDITELKNMAKQLEKAVEKAKAASLSKNEFLANMSHEIRTPLNGLLGMLQLIELTNLEPTQKDYLRTARKSGRNLLQILNDILDLSKVESGKLELEAHEFELGELLDSVASVFRHQAEERGINLSWKLDKSLPRHFSADKGRLRQILFNLVGNASKFTESGSITLEAYPLKTLKPNGLSRIFFSVSDTGIGIPEDKVEAVFDPFTQVDGSLTRKYQGTGLGLGIVHRLVLLMNGDISIMSKEEEGTTIAFTIEAQLNEAPRDATTSVADVNSVQELSILVAEDEHVNRVVVERLLKKIGHTAVSVKNGEEALDILKEQTFDLILTDIQMPGLDGVETTRVIRNEMGITTPIIALTAHAMKGDRDRFIEAGMNGYIAKPFEMGELQNEIDRVMAEATKSKR